MQIFLYLEKQGSSRGGDDAILKNEKGWMENVQAAGVGVAEVALAPNCGVFSRTFGAKEKENLLTCTALLG
jgi:hypothetical protein